MEQNTDRMWWTIGAVVLGGILIAGAILLLNTTLLPNITTKFDELDRSAITNKQDVTHTAYSWSSNGTDRFTTTKPGLNIVKGTSKSFVLTGNAGINQSADLYSFDGPTYLSQHDISEGDILTAEFDWTITNPQSGGFILQWNGTPWGINMPRVNISPSNGSGHVVYSFKAGDYSSSGVKAMGYRLDNVPTNSVLTISKFSLKLTDKSEPWMPSASEVKPSDQPKYIGTYTDKNETASQEPSKYTWKLNPDYHE